MVPEIDILHKEIAKKMSENPPFVGIFACILPAWRFERAMCNTNVPRSLVGARDGESAWIWRYLVSTNLVTSVRSAVLMRAK